MSRERSLRFESPPLHLWLGILGVTKLIEGELRSNLRASFETTLPRFDVMAELYRYESGLRMSAISQKLLVTNGNITGIISQLVHEGLAERIDDPDDGRVSIVRLTDAGVDKFELMAVQHEKWIGELMSGLNKEDVKQLLGLLTKLRKSLHEQLDKPNE